MMNEPATMEGLNPEGKPYRIVICDDKKSEIIKLKQILESRRYKVVETFGNGRELVTWYKRRPDSADCILLDIIMPVLDGYAAFWELKELDPLPRVIFISVENTIGVVKNVIELGASDFITKPLQRDKILERVRKTLERLAVPKE